MLEHPPPPGVGELEERAIWPTFSPAYREYKWTKMSELKTLSQFVVHLMGEKYHGYVLLALT